MQIKQFVPFCQAAHLFLLEGIFNCFMVMVFTSYTEQSRFPECFLTGRAWHVHVWPSFFLAVEPRRDPLHSLAWSLQPVYAAINCAFTVHYKQGGSVHYAFQHSICCLPPTPSPAAAGLLGCHHFPSWVYFVSDLCDLGSQLLPAGGSAVAEQGSQTKTALWK